MKMHKVTTYTIYNIRLKANGTKAKTVKDHNVIYKKLNMWFDADDIQLVVPCSEDENGNPKAIEVFTGKVLSSPNWDENEILVEKHNEMRFVKNTLCGITETRLEIPDTLLMKETFVTIRFKHAQSFGQGINGVDFMQHIVITLKDWEKIMINL